MSSLLNHGRIALLVGALAAPLVAHAEAPAEPAPKAAHPKKKVAANGAPDAAKDKMHKHAAKATDKKDQDKPAQ